MIKKNSVVGLHYKMYDADNNLLDETTEPMVYLHGGYDGIFPLVEEALHEKNIGDTVDVLMQPEDAFGEQDPELVRIEDVKVFPVEVEPGMMFEADDPQHGVVIYRVTDVADGKAVVDGNHPAGGDENPLPRHCREHSRSQCRRNRPRPCPRRARTSPSLNCRVENKTGNALAALPVFYRSITPKCHT